MDRPIKWLAIGALLAANAVSAQTLELTENAHELTLGDVTFPGSTVGTLIFTPCETCDAQSVRVDLETAYLTPQGPMALADFRAYAAELRLTPEADENTLVTVFRSTSDDRVTRVRIHGSD